MSRDGSVEFVWAGDERKFRLGIDELFALQDKLDAGPQQVAIRLRDGSWRIQDLQETYRLALIGAGEDAKVAKSLVERNIVSGRLTSNVLGALAIIISALQGDESDPVGKVEGEAIPPTGSPQQVFTETAQS